MKDIKLTEMIKNLLKENDEKLNEVQVKSGTKATDLQFILRDLSNAYGQGLADDQITDEWKNYTVGQIKDDWINLKKTVNEQETGETKTSDVKSLIKLLDSNSVLKSKLQSVNNAAEVTEFLQYILNTINPKVSGVNKMALKSIIDKRFK